MRKVFWGLFMLISSSILAENAGKPDVEGVIVDQDGNPIEFVNVQLLSATDSTYIQGATSDEEGRFHITTPETGGILRLTCIGYETRYANVSNVQSGKIVLRDDAHLLSEVTVKGQLPKTRLTGNSMITTIEGTVLGQSGSAKEMLGKVPGIVKKGDDLEVLGRGTPIYYINGRKVQDLDELKRLRSEEVMNVEVITNPGAQYDATITSVVRIKTLRRKGEGFGYDLVAANNQDLAYGYADPSATVNLRYRHNDVDVFGMVNYYKWDAVNDSHSQQSGYINKEGHILNIIQNTNLRHDHNEQGLNYNLGFNWQINANHSLGMRVERHEKFNMGVKARISTDMTQLYLDNYLPMVQDYSRSLQDDTQHIPYSMDGNAYYNGQVGKLNIDLNVDFVTNKQDDENNISEWDKSGNISKLSQEQHVSADMLAGKLVLSYPIWKGQLEVGSEMSFVKRTNDYNITGYNLPTTQSDVKEKNLAGFVSYGCNINKIGSLSAGVRYEHVGFDYQDKLNPLKSKSRNTDEFFPSLSWARQFGPVQASLAYSIKTVRPNYNMLDEGIIYINSYSLQQGDPKLKNATMHEVSTNLHWRWLNLFAAYERRDNMQSNWSYLLNDEGVVLVKNINIDKPVRNFAAFLNVAPTFGCYNPSWNIGLQKFFYKQDLIDPREATGMRTVNYTKPIMFFDINNAFRFKHSWLLEANLNVMTKGDVMNFHMTTPSYNLSFVVQKCFLKNDALCLRASINDVLQRSTQKIQLDCGYYTLDHRTINNKHRLNVSVRYTFNASQSKYKGTGAGKDAQERLKD